MRTDREDAEVAELKRTVRQEHIAREAGVSAATVSRVLNNRGPVSDKVRRDVIAAARRLGLGVLEGGTVGLILPDSANPFFTQLAFMLQSRLAREGLLLLMAASENRLDSEVRLLEQFKALSIEALVYIAVSDASDVFDTFLADPTLPIVVIDRRLSVGNLDSVTTTSESATQSAVASLILKGHTRIGYAGGPLDILSAQDRWRAFQNACNFNGLTADDRLHWFEDFTLDGGRAVGSQILESDFRPTAILTGNDLIAIGLMQTLQAAGIQVPAEMSVVGFDDIALSSSIYPSLSTIQQPLRLIVEESARLLSKRISERRAGNYPLNSPEHIELECRFVLRDSVARCTSIAV